jgi:predicted metalloprotease
MADQGDRDPGLFRFEPDLFGANAETRQQPRNSPWALLGVVVALAVVLVVVAVPGRGSQVVEGTPVAAPGVVRDARPNAAAPPSTAETKPPNGPVAPESNELLTPGRSLPQVTCRMPAFGKSAAQLQAYYQAMIDCLGQAWQPVLAEANEPYRAPKLVVDDEPKSTCGVPSTQIAVAFYCPRDETIFMPRNRVVESMGANQGGHIMVLAHEYGHHVQLLSGINLGMIRKLRGTQEDSPEYLELTRRMELQADCFSGMFISASSGRGSISKTLGTSAANSFRSSVTDTTHGTVKHQTQWGTTGVKNNNTSSCNTWVAPAADVS